MHELHYVGRRMQRPDALAKATGAAQYTADLVVHRRDVLHANHFLLILIRLKEKMKNGD